MWRCAPSRRPRQTRPWSQHLLPVHDGSSLSPRDAVEGKGPQRRPQQQLDRRLEEVCQSGWGRLLSVTNAIEAGPCRQGDSGWA